MLRRMTGMVSPSGHLVEHAARNLRRGDDTAMLRPIINWIEKRRQIRRSWQHDARVMLQNHRSRACYEAQRRAARARAEHDRDSFWHWAKVAAEVARLSPDVEMDMKIVQAIADAELDKPNR